MSSTLDAHYFSQPIQLPPPASCLRLSHRRRRHHALSVRAPPIRTSEHETTLHHPAPRLPQARASFLSLITQPSKMLAPCTCSLRSRLPSSKVLRGPQASFAAGGPDKACRVGCRLSHPIRSSHLVCAVRNALGLGPRLLGRAISRSWPKCAFYAGMGHRRSLPLADASLLYVRATITGTVRAWRGPMICSRSSVTTRYRRAVDGNLASS